MRFLHRTSSIAIAAGLAAAAIVLTSCSGSPQGDPTSSGSAPAATTLDELYKKATDAGQDTVLIYGPGEAAFTPVYDEFTKKFPKIKVTSEFLFGGDLDARLQQEATTGQHAGDLVHLDDVVRYHDMMEKFTPAGDLELPDGVKLFDGQLYVPDLSPYVFAYNADKLSEDQVPSSWADVTSDKFSDLKIGMSDPTSLAATSTTLYLAYKHGSVDEDWFKALAAKKPTIYKSTSQMVTAIAGGEIDFTPVAYYGFVLAQQAQGANVKAVVPSDGVNLTNSPYGVLDGAPHDLAAQLLVSWLLSPEGQTAIASMAGEYPTMPGAPAPEGLPAIGDLDRFEQPAPEDFGTFKEDAVKYLKTFF